MGKLNVMDNTGHTVVEFTPDVTSEATQKAEALFKEFMDKRYVAYKKKLDAGDGGTTHELIKAFDPTAEDITLRPFVVGG